MTLLKNEEYNKAAVEVLDILDHTKKEEYNKIPKNLIIFLRNVQSKDYKSNINHNLPLINQNLNSKTIALLAMIYRSYFCNGLEKEVFDEILIANQTIIDSQIKEKLPVNDIFKDKSINLSKEMIIRKEDNFLIKIIHKIKSFLLKI